MTPFPSCHSTRTEKCPASNGLARQPGPRSSRQGWKASRCTASSLCVFAVRIFCQVPKWFLKKSEVRNLFQRFAIAQEVHHHEMPINVPINTRPSWTPPPASRAGKTSPAPFHLQSPVTIVRGSQRRSPCATRNNGKGHDSKEQHLERTSFPS